MLTITTADPSNTQTKLKRIIEVPRCPGKSRLAKTIVNIPGNTPLEKLNEIYQSLIDDDIDLYNPHLNVRDAYIKHVEQQNADLKTQINDLQDLLSQSDRVILALIASLLVFAVIAVAMVWG
nr:hypothetical protein [Moraxella sp. CTOTU48841]